MEGRQVVAVLSVADRKRLLGVEDYSGRNITVYYSPARMQSGGRPGSG